MYYVSVIQHHIRSFWWQESKISGSDHVQIQKDSLEIYGLLINSKTMVKNADGDSGNGSQTSISNQTVGVLLPKYITEKLALLLAGTHLTEIHQFLSSHLEQIFSNPQYRQYAYYVLKAFADQLQSPLIKLPVSKLNEFKQLFFQAIHQQYFDQILTDLAKLRNTDMNRAIDRERLVANTELASFENLTNLYVSTIGSIVSITPADICFRPSLSGFLDFILDVGRTPTKCIVESIQILEELLSKQDLSGSQYAVIEIIGKFMVQSLTLDQMLKDEEILSALVELAYIFVRDHFCRIIGNNTGLARDVLYTIHKLTFNLVVDDEELTEDIIDWNGLFIRCLDIWQAFFDTLRNFSMTSQVSITNLNGFTNLYPELMEALIQALQTRCSAKVAGLDRQRNYTSDVKQDDGGGFGDEIEEANMSEWDEFYQSIITSMVELGSINEGRDIVFNRMVGLLEEICGALKDEAGQLQNGQNHHKSYDSITSDVTQGIEPVLQDVSSIISSFEQILIFARPDRPQTLQSIFKHIFEIASWAETCQAGFLVHEELVSEVFTSCLFTLKAMLPWCAVQQDSSQSLQKIAEFTNEQITDKAQDWRLRRAKSTLFEAIISVAQTPSQVPDLIRSQTVNEAKIIEILKSAIISYNTNHSSSDFKQNMSTANQNNKFLPERVKIRAMNTLLIQPWKSQDNLSWHEKAELHGKFISVVLKPLLDSSNNCNEEKYICLVMCRDMIKSSSNFTNSKPRTIIAKSVEGVLNSVSNILPESLKQENMDIQQTMLNQECMAIAMTVLESIRIQVGVTWCSSFVDMMMETVTKSKVAFLQSMTGVDASLTVLGRFIVVLQTCLTCESSSFKKKFEAVPILQFVVGALWKQLCKYCDKNDNGSGIKGMLIKFLTNVLGYRWRTFFPELVGKWKTIDEANNTGDNGDTVRLERKGIRSKKHSLKSWTDILLIKIFF